MWWDSPSGAIAIAGLGLLPGQRVVEYSATVTVLNPTAFKDASSAVLGLAERLADLGFLARILNPSVGYLTSSFKVVLSKNDRQPFSVNDAKVALVAAAARQSLSIKTLYENAGEIVTFVAEAPGHAMSEKGRQQTKDALDKTFWEFWESIPTSVKVVGGAAVGLFALAQVASISRAVRS